jgi:LPXTG-motif cell wall-anchored protein
MTRLLRIVVLLTAVAVSLVLAAVPAVAETVERYGTVVEGEELTPAPAPMPVVAPEAESTPTLPVTGGDIAGMVLIGVTLIGAGAGFVVVRRRAAA